VQCTSPVSECIKITTDNQCSNYITFELKYQLNSGYGIYYIYTLFLYREYKPAVNPTSRSRFKRQVAAHFGAKAAGYSDHAVIQQEMLDRLVPIIMRYDHSDTLFLDAGCGNGLLERKLTTARFSGTIVGLDIAYNSLRYAAAHSGGSDRWLGGDIEYPPIKPHTVTGVIAASVLQWSANLSHVLDTITSLLRPGGIFIFSLFTEKSFKELAEARRQSGLEMPVTFPASAALPALFTASHLIPEHTETIETSLYFPSAIMLLQHLSSIGSTASTSRMSRAALRKFCTTFETMFRTDRGIPLTYEAVAGICHKGEQL